MKEPRKVARLYAILDTLNVHDHPNFKTIVFSDTILVYNPEEVHTDDERNYLVWFLTEFAEDLHRRLTGQGIWFRAVLLAGQFEHYRLKNVECFYGDALIKAYESEKKLPFIGLIIADSAIKYNRFFETKPLSPGFTFAYISRQLNYLDKVVASFPAKDWIVSDAAPDIAYDVRFLKDLHSLMRSHRDPLVRAKALATWDFYVSRYPAMLSALERAEFALSALGPQGAWSENETAVEADIRYFKRIGSGTHLSTTISRKKS